MSVCSGFIVFNLHNRARGLVSKACFVYFNWKICANVNLDSFVNLRKKRVRHKYDGDKAKILLYYLTGTCANFQLLFTETAGIHVDGQTRQSYSSKT